jgi:hypothetical protein
MYRHHTIICPQCRLPHELLDFHLIPKNYTVIEFLNYLNKTTHSPTSLPFSSHSSPSHHLEHEIHCLDGQILPSSFSSASASSPCISSSSTTSPSHEFLNSRKPLEDLTVEEVSQLLIKLKLSKFLEIFSENEIDGVALSHCRDEEDLIQAGIHIKVKARFLFEKLQSYQVLGVPMSSLVQPTNTSLEGERRDGEGGGGGGGGSGDRRDGGGEGVRLTGEMEVGDEGVSLWIVGMRGIYEFMNGLYYPTEEIWMGRRRYFKLQYDCWIEYNSDYHQWHIKPHDKKTTTNAWAYLSALPSTLYPYEAMTITSAWHLYDSLTFIRHENIFCFPHFSIYLAGISTSTGGNGGNGDTSGGGDISLNGYYEPVPHDLSGGICRYRQRSYGAASFGTRARPSRAWLEYSSPRQQWELKYEEDLNSPSGALLILSSSNPREIWSSVLPWTLPASSPLSLSSSTVSSLPLSFPKLYSLEITGGNGPTAAHIRGVYQPSHEVFGGWVRYHKVTDENCWLEKMESQEQWHVKPTKDKTKTNAWACIKYSTATRTNTSASAAHMRRGRGDLAIAGPPPYLLQEEGWLIYNGSVFLDDPELKCRKKLPLI